MNIGTYNQKNINQGQVKNVAINQFAEMPQKVKSEFVNTVSKSKNVTLDLSQFLEDYNEPNLTNQQLNNEQPIKTLFDDFNRQ